MTGRLAGKTAAWLGTGVALAVLGWLWLQAPWTALWPVVSAAAALVAAAVVWTDVVPGRPREAWAALVAGLLVAAEALSEYLLLPAATWPGQSAAGAAVFLAACLAAALGAAPGWRIGLRVGLGAAVVATAGQTLIFGLWLGQPVQAVVLEAQGALSRFEASQSTDFLVWTVADRWSGVAPGLVLGAALGTLGGFLGGLFQRRQTRG